MKYTLMLILANALVYNFCFGQPVQKEKSVILSFEQGGTNCASISVIKLAIDQYGAFKVCKKIDTVPGGYQITLRDGRTFALTNEEIAITGHLDKFIKGDDETIFNWAKFYYAVMAKNKQLTYQLNEISDAADTVVNIRKDVHNYQLAENTIQNIKFLGLEDLIDEKEDLTPINSLAGIIITNARHSAFSSVGYYDEMGQVMSNSEFVNHHSSFFTKLWGIRGLNAYYIFKN